MERILSFFFNSDFRASICYGISNLGLYPGYYNPKTRSRSNSGSLIP